MTRKKPKPNLPPLAEIPYKARNRPNRRLERLLRLRQRYEELSDDELREELQKLALEVSGKSLRRGCDAFAVAVAGGGYEVRPVAKPRVAPRLYADRENPDEEDIVQFVDDVYGTWLDGKNFTLGDLRLLDPQAAAAVDQRRRRGTWPSAVKLPSVPEAHDALLSDPTIGEKVREARRLVRLYDSRKAKPA